MVIQKTVGVSQIGIPACGGGVDLAPSLVNGVILQGVPTLPSHLPHYHQQDASAAVGLKRWTSILPTNLWGHPDTLWGYGPIASSFDESLNYSQARFPFDVGSSRSTHCSHVPVSSLYFYVFEG